MGKVKCKSKCATTIKAISLTVNRIKKKDRVIKKKKKHNDEPKIKEMLIEESKENECTFQTSIQIYFQKPDTDEVICKTLKVHNRLTVQDCIELCLQELGYSDNEIKDYKLWVKTGKDQAPYPLIGHESPFCIKMSFIRELLQMSDLDLRNLNYISTYSKCYFILRKNSINNSPQIDSRVQKKLKKHKRPHLKINWLFWKPASKHDSVDSGNSSPTPHNFFGLPLSKSCPDNVIPKPVMSMLVQLFLQGPYTVGIFRIPANAGECRELKEKLKTDPECDISNVSIIVLSSVFKEFLRSLPDCLLQSNLYKHWLQAVSFDSHWECKKKVLSLLSQLPPPNIRLLQYLVCMLWHVAQHSSENKMSSMNLAICIGPTLLNPGETQSPALYLEDVAERVPKTVAFLIDHCAELFGDQMLKLLGAFPERDTSRQDSGAEESDSLQSLQDLANWYRCDYSSIDSLDRDFLILIETSPKLPYKSKLSLTNLSRDSGLTFSDTQLYTSEEEVESESSSADSRRGDHLSAAQLTKSVPRLNTAGIDCNTASYGKNAGISIDGSCHNVVRKRCEGMEAHRTKSLEKTCSSFNNQDYYNGDSPHLPLQLSQSYSYSMLQDLMDKSYDNFVRNYRNPVRRRDVRGRSLAIQKPVVSAVLEPMDTYVEGILRKSASEESLIQSYVTISASKRMLNQRKHRAPPHQKISMSAPCSITKKTDHPSMNDMNREMTNCSINKTPDRYAVWYTTHSRRTDWKERQSTSKIDEIDQVHYSSILSLVSSEGSTPQVSRSNSRVQDLSSSKSHGDIYAIYYHPPRVNSVYSSTSDGSHHLRCSQTSARSNGSHHSQRSSDSVGGSSPAKPPSYLEVINRQTLQNLQQLVKQVTEEMKAEQTSRSTKSREVKARELYENSVKMYSQQILEEAKSKELYENSAIYSQQETHRTIPVYVDKTVKGTQSSPHINNDQEGSHSQLRHLPPATNVSDAQFHRTRNFRRPRHIRRVLPEKLRKEINWSVAELREMFSARHRGACDFTEDSFIEERHPKRLPQEHNTRNRSLGSRSEEEPFV